MDEKELETLFRAAPGDAPPPGFTLGDVKSASAQATARRRSALILATGCAVIVLGGAGIVGIAQFRGGETASSTSALSQEQPAHNSGRLPKASTPSPLQGSGGTGEDGPRAEGTPGCDKVDRELATALAGELPATGVTGPSPGRVCTTGSRSAGFHVADGDRAGFVSVTVVPSGVALSLVTGAVTAEAASGGTVVVLSTPDAGSAAPLEGDLSRIAAALAARF